MTTIKTTEDGRLYVDPDALVAKNVLRFPGRGWEAMAIIALREQPNGPTSPDLETVAAMVRLAHYHIRQPDKIVSRLKAAEEALGIALREMGVEPLA